MAADVKLKLTMPFVRSLKFVFMNLLLPGDLALWLCPWSLISSSDPESERWGPPPSFISLDAASYFARLSLFVGVGFFDSGELSSPLSYLLLVTLLRTPAKTQDIDGAPVLWSAPRSVGNLTHYDSAQPQRKPVRMGISVRVDFQRVRFVGLSKSRESRGCGAGSSPTRRCGRTVSAPS